MLSAAAPELDYHRRDSTPRASCSVRTTDMCQQQSRYIPSRIHALPHGVASSVWLCILMVSLLVAGSLSQIAVLPQARAQLAAVAVGDVVIFAGGIVMCACAAATCMLLVDSNAVDRVGNRTPSAEVDVWYLSSNSWRPATLSVPRSGIAGAGTTRYAVFAGGQYAPLFMQFIMA